MGMGAPEPFIPDVDEESLILQFPDKWYPYYKSSDVKVDTFVFPTGQKPEKWREALQYEKFLAKPADLGVTRARQVYEIKIQASARGCPNHTETLLTETQENGYSMSQWTEKCVSADESIIVMLNKTIVGNDRLYNVSKIWKSEPKEKDMEKWLSYMRDVYVCDPNTGVNPCMPPNGPEGGPGGGRG